jgi:hypothetical protein
MQAEQGTVGITSSIGATQDADVTTAVEATFNDDTSTATGAATTNIIRPVGAVHLINMPETTQSITSSSSSDQGIAETPITAVYVDTSATGNTSSCSSASESTVVESVTASTATVSTASDIVNNTSGSNGGLPQVKLAVDTKEQTVRGNTESIKLSVLRCDGMFTPVNRAVACRCRCNRTGYVHVIMQSEVLLLSANSCAVVVSTCTSHANIFNNFQLNTLITHTTAESTRVNIKNSVSEPITMPTQPTWLAISNAS